MRSLGLDIHCTFVEVVTLAYGPIHSLCRGLPDRDDSARFVQNLLFAGEVVLGATGNTLATVNILEPDEVCA